jgi:flagellin-like protein
MKLDHLFTDDDAVSPVIGVILMVAITVILAAVIASFVLGLGNQPQETPQTQFDFEYDGSTLTITHNGGDTFDSNDVEIRGETGDGSSNAGQQWHAYGGGTATDISTGDDISFAAGDSYDITVVYAPPGSDTSSPLADDQGPNA